MVKIFFGILIVAAVSVIDVPEVKVSGAMKNIMMQGDLSAHINLDTLNKIYLFALGPVAGLKGEIMILDGKVYSTTMQNNQLQNQQDKISQAAMLVYSHVEKWKPVISKVKINNYAELEKLIETTAIVNGYDLEIPFAFKIETTPQKAAYHVIDWKEGTAHTMENHKQFAYTGHLDNTSSVLVGFYSKHHQSIFTHHTTYMHIHLLDEKTKTVGHLDDIQVNGEITIYLPEK
jgi:acetolactate decarboxylase